MSDEQRILSVFELTLLIKGLLETTLPSVWVAGEVSNLSLPRSGHCYLTLKDPQAQLPAVIWRSTLARVRFEPADGLEVICRGRIDVYPPHGKYQLIVEQIQPKGMGALELALRQLREKLAREGLFDPARKRRLPAFPRRIAVVTSPTGAAIRDFLEVLRRRWRGADVLVAPVRVQGEGAGREIAEAIATINRLAVPIDCLVVTRGGGSLEDLWAFNEEVVCRAIHASRIPVVSAVGHEIDVTLADLVADVRAATPSEAAERIVPASEEIALRLRDTQRRMAAALGGRLRAAGTRLEAVASRPVLRRPFDRVHDLGRRLDELAARGDRAIGRLLDTARRRLEATAGRLESLSPLAVLGRGYSVTQRESDGLIVRDASVLAAGDLLRTRFARGEAMSRVEPSGPNP
jgi:exodeoxyribonuclease VII large subunit